jgi:hypothetical protein
LNTDIHKRGSYGMATFGVSFGGGQKVIFK